MPKKSGSSPKSGSLKSLKVAVFLGGDSPEREISLKSGTAVKNALESLGYSVSLVDPSSGKLQNLSRADIDVAFIALHGRGGEDGVIQSVLERKRISYTGSKPLGCRLSFDKARTKGILRRKGLPTADYIVIDAGDPAWESRVMRFGAPFFVKPLDDGSSIGVFCAESLTTGITELKKALKKYKRLLVERKVTGREFTVAVLDGKALPVIELRPKRKFYDYKAKYTKGLCRYLVPAPIDRALSGRMQKIAAGVHRVLKLRDVCRVDIMMDREGGLYVLEANAIPGLTGMSLLPKAARESGISFERLCEMLILKAAKRRRVHTTKRVAITI